MSRDLYRLTKSLSIERQLSLLHGGFGFYIVNCLTMYILQVSGHVPSACTPPIPSPPLPAPSPSMRVCPYVPSLQATAFLLALLNIMGLLPYFQTGSAVSLTSINLWMPAFVSVALLLPDAVMVWHERGVRLGLHYLYGKLITLAPLYYIFIAQTRAYHFANTMRWGSAGTSAAPTHHTSLSHHPPLSCVCRSLPSPSHTDYYVTRRAVSITHTLHYTSCFMAYGRSHFYPAIELILVPNRRTQL